MPSIRKVETEAMPGLSDSEKTTLARHVDALHATVGAYPQETIDKAHRSGLWHETEDWISAAASSTFGIFRVLMSCEPGDHAVTRAREQARSAHESLLKLAFWSEGSPQAEDFVAARDALVDCRESCRQLL